VEIALGALRTLLWRVGGIVIWALIGVISARALSVEDRGTYASMIALLFIVAALSPGIGDAAGYFVTKRGHRPGEILAAILLLSVVVSIVQFAALAAWGAVRWEDRTLIPIVGLGLFPQLARLSLSGLFMGTGHLTRMALGSQGQAYWGLVAIVLWVLILDHRTAEDALGAYVVAQWVTLAALMVLAEPEWRRDLRRGVSWGTVRAMVTYGSLPGLATLVAMSNTRLGQVMVIRLDGAAGAGIYASAITIAEGLWLFSSSASSAAFRRIGTLPGDEAARLTARTFRYLMPVVAIPAIGISLFAPWLIGGLYGERYTDGATALRIFCLAAVIFAPVSLLNTYFLAQLGRPIVGLLLSTVNTTINIALCLLLIPRIGYEGAAVAALCAFTVSTTTAIVLFLRLSGLPASELWRIGPEDIEGYRAAARRLRRGRRVREETAQPAGSATSG
jgi:O-antigen/teichoic acid export membrane protein